MAKKIIQLTIPGCEEKPLSQDAINLMLLKSQKSLFAKNYEREKFEKLIGLYLNELQNAVLDTNEKLSRVQEFVYGANSP